MSEQSELLERQIKALEESILHWDRMAWAARKVSYDFACYIEDKEKGIPRPDPATFAFITGLKENWYSDSCACCLEFMNEILLGIPWGCQRCPLRVYLKGRCGEHGHPWTAVAQAKTWTDWQDAADNMCTILRACLADLKKKNSVSEEENT